MMEQIDSVIEKNVCMRRKTNHKGKCQREAAKNGEVVLLQNKEGDAIFFFTLSNTSSVLNTISCTASFSMRVIPASMMSKVS